MRDDIFKRMIELEQCPDDVQRMVLRLPDGTLSPEEEEKALEHIAHCDSCRYMLEFYGEFLETLAEEADREGDDKKPWLEIPIAVASSGMTASRCEYLRTAGPVHVLSDNVASYEASKPSNALEFDVPFGPDHMVLFRVIKAGGRLNIEIDSDDPKSRYYLISGNDFRIASPIKGRAAFDGVPPGDMVVSEEMRRFIKISITGGDVGR